MSEASNDKDDDDDDDDIPQLSAETLALLLNFQQEKAAHTARLDALLTIQDTKSSSQPTLTIADFTEDWNTSQFWYNNATATTFAHALLSEATDSTNIAIVSVPSVFIILKNLLNSPAYAHLTPKLSFLEFDDRFAVFQDEYVHYDFNHPLRVPARLQGTFDRIICDPPFLSEECQTEFATMVKWLLRPEAEAKAGGLREPRVADSTSRVIVCTGQVMESLVLQSYSGMRTTTYEPVHEQGRLTNEWSCFANFECEAWTFAD